MTDTAGQPARSVAATVVWRLVAVMLVALVWPSRPTSRPAPRPAPRPMPRRR